MRPAQTHREKRRGEAGAHLSPRACHPRLCASAGVSPVSLAGGFWKVRCPPGDRTSTRHLPLLTEYRSFPASLHQPSPWILLTLWSHDSFSSSFCGRRIPEGPLSRGVLLRACGQVFMGSSLGCHPASQPIYLLPASFAP